MTRLRLDHIAVAGNTLAEAKAHIEDALGVSLQPGGQHPRFGTHNTLLGLADGLYLEAIAIDPDAPKPDRPRWFGLDQFGGPARLTTWICATDDLADLPPGMEDAGSPVALTRGDLAWQMSVPDDGALPFDGLHPALIQWEGTAHPAARLADAGCRLLRLDIRHPDAAQLSARLTPHLDDPRLSFATGPASLSAEFETPHGRRVLT
ncbi:VOC family protein [Chachezhania antarctica]|uniref:VOC family protein n=1 Tax=Chachezhania antarctica TaxID=2340860 RepID=UPI000EB4BEF9|nr:VOC family protein [Chachezhania antarctica]